MDIDTRRDQRSSSDPTCDTGRISVVIPVRNGAAHLRATLQSVLDQQSAPGEVIVVDDGSTDDTAAIAHSFGVTVISQVNRGLSAARNVGTQAARGEYIAYLDGDDVWAPEKLAVQLASLLSLDRPAFSFTDYRMFNENRVYAQYGVTTHPAFRKIVGAAAASEQVVIDVNDVRPVLADDYILPSTTLVRREDVMAIGGFDETLGIAEDHDFYLRLFTVAAAVGILKPLVMYRRHATQISAKPIVLVKSFFEIQKRMIATPERYPAADVRHFRKAAYIAHRRVGVLHTRLGQFDEGRTAFRLSLGSKWTLLSALGWIAASLGGTSLGRRVFVGTRSVLRAVRATRSRAAVANTPAASASGAQVASSETFSALIGRAT